MKKLRKITVKHLFTKYRFWIISFFICIFFFLGALIFNLLGHKYSRPSYFIIYYLCIFATVVTAVFSPVIYIIINNKKEMAIIGVILFEIIAVSCCVGYLSQLMSTIFNNKIKVETWISFSGTIIGAAIGVLGAFFVMKIQMKDADKKLLKKNEKENNCKREFILSVIKNEIELNNEIFNRPSNPGISTQDKFAIDEWNSIKDYVISLFNDESSREFAKKLVDLYNVFFKINYKIENSERHSYLIKSDEKAKINEGLAYVQRLVNPKSDVDNSDEAKNQNKK